MSFSQWEGPYYIAFLNTYVLKKNIYIYSGVFGFSTGMVGVSRVCYMHAVGYPIKP